MKSKKPNLPVGLLGKKCTCGGTCQMRSSEEIVNHQEHLLLVEARGCEPTGAAWKVQVLAPSLQAAFDFFKDLGLRGIRIVSESNGTSSSGRQNRGSTMLLLGVIGEEVSSDE